MRERILELAKLTEGYFTHPDFDKKSKINAITAEMPEYEDYLNKKRLLLKNLHKIDPDLHMFYIEPLLSPNQEKHLFRQLNYYKQRVQKTIKNTRITEDEKLNKAESYFQEYLKVRNLIISCNFRLVANEAKKNLKYTKSHDIEVLKSLISDGNIGLARAVDYFDPQKGNKFSTYCTWAIRRSIWGYKKKSISSSNVDEMVLNEAKDYRENPIETMERKQYIEFLLKHARPTEKMIIIDYYIEGKNLAQIALKVGVTKERIRQIKEEGISRIRKFTQKVA